MTRIVYIPRICIVRLKFEKIITALFRKKKVYTFNPTVIKGPTSFIVNFEVQ